MITAFSFFTFTGEILVGTSTGVLLLVAKFLRKRAQCFDIVQSRSLRQSHAILLMAQSLDSLVMRFHGSYQNLTGLVDTALRDENNNL